MMAAVEGAYSIVEGSDSKNERNCGSNETAIEKLGASECEGHKFDIRLTENGGDNRRDQCSDEGFDEGNRSQSQGKGDRSGEQIASQQECRETAKYLFHRQRVPCRFQETFISEER